MVVLETPAEVATAAAQAIAAHVGERAKRGERTSVMLAGGTTPRATYEQLARLTVDFGLVDFYFGDERAVPPEHPDSNHGMVKAALFDQVRSPGMRVFPMRGDADDLDAAARAYDELLPASIDVLLLGMGEDGHTASLFPGSPALAERSRRVLRVVGPKPPPVRLTITPVVIEAAASAIVLVTGAGKAEALARAGGPIDLERTPVQAAQRGVFYADRAAASRYLEGTS